VRDLASILRGAGVRAGDTVAVLGRRDAGLVTSMLATWTVGAQLLLLDPGYPAARLAAYVAAARPRCLITGPEPAPDLAVPGLVVLDRIEAHVVRTARADTTAGSPEPGYIAFTSGTTGEPVAVAGKLGPIEHFLNWYAAESQLDAADRFALLAGVSHDPVFRDVLLPLYCGATLNIPPPDAARVPRDLAHWLRECDITVANLTPPLARLLSAEGVRLPALRLICLGGDAVTAADVAVLTALAPRAVLINGYGTTETPQLTSRRRMSPGEPVSLGAQAPGSQLLILDADGRRCGIGEAGRIVVRSRHLATVLRGGPGDHGRVLEDPVPGVGRFATGDLGRYRTDGSVEFLGRNDDIVNVRGFRAHPAETDRALASDPRITASVTVPWAGPDGAELVSYVVGVAVEPADIRARLATLLPAFLVPTAVIVMNRLPLTGNGKIDRAALPPPRSGRPAPHRTTGTSGPLEHQLADLLSGILGLAATDRVDVEASLFELGATSLHLLRLHSAIRRDVDARLPLLALYESPSIRALARRLSDWTSAPAAATGTTGERRGSRADERARRRAARQTLPETAGHR
jgi:acyl-coenzyme A synthetase/AMP-(fatty) acid ligase/acyl carrier protein